MSPLDAAHIEAILEKYRERRPVLEMFAATLRNDLESHPTLRPHVHSIRWRLKDPEHLREKLVRKQAEADAAGVVYDIAEDTLLTKMNDLVGVRILHLYQDQMKMIDPALKAMLPECLYELLEGPRAMVWDGETKAYFESIGIECVDSEERMYTSVHYVVGSRRSGGLTAEIQVRTLAEELWGEVDHRLNYPQKTESIACREQIRVLARITSGCTRLADAIFRSHREYEERRAAGR